MAETLGEKLRAAREERGVSISEVAEQTRIAPMYIECIENDNYKPLPGGIFNKGFVKSYARFIGYDEQEAVQEYSQIASRMEGTQDDHLRTYRPEVLTDDRASQSTLPTIIFAGIILALMTGGILFLVNYLQNRPATDPVASNEPPANGTTSPSPGTSTDPAPGGVPTMQNIQVEFRTITNPISLSATSDGNNSIDTVNPGTPKVFEPRQSLKLSFAKSLAASAQLFINGKQITLPSQPANPRRIPIEIEINAENLAQVWSSGAITFDSVAMPAASTVSTSTPQATASPASETPTESPRPTTPSPTARTSPASANRPRTTPTPIVVGGNRSATPRSTPN